MQVSYIINDTQEQFDFDYIVGCNSKLSGSIGGGGSRSEFLTFEPQSMYMPTPNGAAIMVRSMRACNDKKLERVPAGFLPFTIWFDSVEDMDFGWGYKNEVAYKRPNSKLTFLKATLTKSNYDEWKAWRKKAKLEYKQIGDLPGPWGYSSSSSSREQQEFVFSLTETGGNIAGSGSCRSYWRIQLPEKVFAELKKIDPGSLADGQYWVVRNENIEVSYILSDGEYDGVDSFYYYRSHPDHISVGGSYRESGDGFYINPRLENKEVSYLERYPVLPFSRSVDYPLNEPQDSYYHRLMVGKEWEGLVACGNDKPADSLYVWTSSRESIWEAKQAGHEFKDFIVGGRKLGSIDITASFDPDYADKDYYMMINNVVGEKIKSQYRLPPKIIDRENGWLYVLSSS